MADAEAQVSLIARKALPRGAKIQTDEEIQFEWIDGHLYSVPSVLLKVEMPLLDQETRETTLCRLGVVDQFHDVYQVILGRDLLKSYLPWTQLPLQGVPDTCSMPDNHTSILGSEASASDVPDILSICEPGPDPVSEPEVPAASCQPLTISPPTSSTLEEVSPPVKPKLVFEGDSTEDSFTSPHQIPAREDSSPVPEHTASLGDSTDSQPVGPSRPYRPVPRKRFWNKFCRDCGRKGHMSANYRGCANHNIPAIAMAVTNPSLLRPPAKGPITVAPLQSHYQPSHVRAYDNSGAQISLIQEDRIPRGANVDRRQLITIEGINHIKLILPTVQLRVTRPHFSKVCTLAVASYIPGGYDLLLGQDMKSPSQFKKPTMRFRASVTWFIRNNFVYMHFINITLIQNTYYIYT
ncbi:uncharacterized protein LOC135212099 [Macrobrachium nipponense]|uniref:uncharacterized protein LOC135212099 n=1 Tax=Macrobrachium nipponense TaxID=159736 RepID=UPI0030C8C1F1